MIVKGFSKPIGFINYPNQQLAFSKFYFLKDGNNYLVNGLSEFPSLVPKIAGVDKTYYVDFSHGNDGNSGVTLGTAFKSLNVALAKPDVDVVLVTSGDVAGYNTFTRNYGWNNISPTRSVTIKSLDAGKTILTAAERINHTWESTATSWVKKTTAAGLANSIIGIIDKNVIDSNGDALLYTNHDQIDSVTAQPGSWCKSGGYVYIHCIGDRLPDDKLRLFVDGNNGFVTDNITVYVEGIIFEGGTCPFYVANVSGNATRTPKLIFNNCEFKYGGGVGASGGSGAGGLSTIGAKDVYLNNCKAFKNVNDGFNYHSRDGIVQQALEINCVSYGNGSESGSDNASTMHDGGIIVRINGIYHTSFGPIIQDIGIGTLSWNIGCTCHSARYPANPDRETNFMSGDGTDSTRMWLDGCVSYDSTYDLCANSGSNIFKRNLNSNNSFYGNGTIEDY
jgi:hypothetical protein